MKPEKAGRTWSFLMSFVEVDNLCLSQGEHYKMNQTRDMKTKPRPRLKKKSPLPCILQLSQQSTWKKALAELM